MRTPSRKRKKDIEEKPLASWLVLDWDQDQFHIVSAQSARRGAQIVKAASWAHPEPFTPSTAERVGKALRDFLKSAQIPAAPVIVGLGRDRIFLKELRFPPIAAHEEAALVRFQTGKELTESVDSYAVDYVHMNSGSGERQIMTVAARRDVLAMIQTMCQAAGLKLHAVTPKLFGAGAAVERALRPDPSPLVAKKLNVVLSVGQRWAELCFFDGPRLLQAQALANGPLLAAEVKRNLAVFRAQHAVNLDLTGPDCLYMFGEDKSAVQSLENGSSNLPVHVLDPLGPEPKVGAAVKQTAPLAGAAGLAELWSQAVQKPINLAAPKRQQAPSSVTRQRGIFYGVAAGIFLTLAIGGMWYVLAQKRAEIARLTKDKADYEKQLADNAQERADLEAYKEWEQTTIPWLDELYDLTARYPFEQGFRVNQLSAQTLGAKKNKDSYVGVLNLTMYTPNGKGKYVADLQQTMSRDSHLRSAIGPLRILPGTNAPHEYKMKIDIAKQVAEKYDTRLFVPAPQVIIAPPPAVAAKAKDPEPEPEPDPGVEP
jgi:hypothetical protein